VAAAVSVALPTAAGGARLHVYARWSLTMRGSLTHTWSLPSSDPCQATGEGHATMRFASPHAVHIVIADNGYGLADVGWNSEMPVDGTVTAVDARTRNPPQAGSACDTSEPVPDTRACGSARSHAIVFVSESVSRRGRFYAEGGLDTNALTPDAKVADCETDGLTAFTAIGGAAGSSRHVLPIDYPSPETLTRRRGTFTLTAHDSHHFNGTSTTVRTLTLTFHRTG